MQVRIDDAHGARGLSRQHSAGTCTNHAATLAIIDAAEHHLARRAAVRAEKDLLHQAKHFLMAGLIKISKRCGGGVGRLAVYSSTRHFRHGRTEHLFCLRQQFEVSAHINSYPQAR